MKHYTVALSSDELAIIGIWALNTARSQMHGIYTTEVLNCMADLSGKLRDILDTQYPDYEG